MRKVSSKKSKKRIGRSFRNKPFWVTCISLLVCMLLVFSYALSQFHKMELSSDYLFKTLYLNVVGIRYAFIPKPTPAPYVPSASHAPINFPTSAPIPILPPVPPTEYTSSRLGIRFSYLSLLPYGSGQKFFIKEIGNTIYVYYKNSSTSLPFTGSDQEFVEKIAPHAKYIQVFSKESPQSFDEAIQQQVLRGYSQSDCVITHPAPYGSFKKDSSRTAMIKVPQPKVQLSYLEYMALFDKCPRKYTNASGVTYFMMDPNYPHKFLFISIGQDNLESGIENYSWDETIKIIN